MRRWLAESKFQSCVFIHNYPRKIKAFYMRDNIGMSDLNNGDDCDDCDDHGHHNVDDNIWLYVWHE